MFGRCFCPWHRLRRDVARHGSAELRAHRSPPGGLVGRGRQEVAGPGLNVNACFEAACSVTNEWIYKPARDGRHWTAAINVRSRLRQRRQNERLLPVTLRPLDEILDPQPLMSEPIARLLDWIDREDAAWRAGAAQPKFETEEGEGIFPPMEEEWWLTDVARQRPQEAAVTAVEEDGPASDLDEGGHEVGDGAVTDDDASEEGDTDEDAGSDAGRELWREGGDDYNIDAAMTTTSAQVPRRAPLLLCRWPSAAATAPSSSALMRTPAEQQDEQTAAAAVVPTLERIQRNEIIKAI